MDLDFTKRERGVYRSGGNSKKMTQGKGILIAYCDACFADKQTHQRTMVVELKVSSGRIIRLCEKCLREPLERLHAREDTEGVHSQGKAPEVLKQSGVVGYVEP